MMKSGLYRPRAWSVCVCSGGYFKSVAEDPGSGLESVQWCALRIERSGVVGRPSSHH